MFALLAYLWPGRLLVEEQLMILWTAAASLSVSTKVETRKMIRHSNALQKQIVPMEFKIPLFRIRISFSADPDIASE
jgi:hypothetical protein